VVQFGFGRVSTTHAPWLQYWPAPQLASAVHPVEPVPPSLPPVTVGSQTVFTHVKPAPHAVVAQLVRHCPSAQTFESLHSLEYLQAFVLAVQDPATHVWSFAQSLGAEQGHGPAVPPHAGLVLASDVPPPDGPASDEVTFVPGEVPGGEQRPLWHVSPFGHDASEMQVRAQPVVVQTAPLPHVESLEQAGCAGAVTFEQPYASHV
jgi:hypothetical protein